MGIFYILLPQTTRACCAENNYRLFPMGEVDNELVFLELSFFRSCRGDRDSITHTIIEYYWMSGVINLVKWNGDSIAFLENVDTVKFQECECLAFEHEEQYRKSTYEKHIAPYYAQALSQVSQMPGYSPITPKGIEFNQVGIVESESNDSAYYHTLAYRGLIDLDVSHWDIISCYPTRIAEHRVYASEHYTVHVVRLSCQNISQKAIKHRKRRFKKLKTAFWKEQATWHGIVKDMVVVKPKE